MKLSELKTGEVGVIAKVNGHGGGGTASLLITYEYKR